MTKLTDTQLIVLNAAAQRSTLLALSLPPKLKGGAAHKVIHPLIDKGLLEEVDADRRLGEPVWRKTGDGHGVTLAITEAGLAALGIDADGAPQAGHSGEEAVHPSLRSKISRIADEIPGHDSAASDVRLVKGNQIVMRESKRNRRPVTFGLLEKSFVSRLSRTHRR